MNPLAAPLNAINNRPLRERLLIGLTLLASLIATLDWTLLQPLRARNQAAVESIARLRIEQDDARIAHATRLAEVSRRENEAGETALRRMREEIARLQQNLRSTSLGTVSPADMVSVLREMFSGDDQVQLTVLENAAPQPIVEVAVGSGDETHTRPMLYRHPLIVEFTGDYTRIVEHLKRIEALDWQLVWDDFSIVMEQYPRARARVVLHTLSVERGWVGA